MPNQICFLRSSLLICCIFLFGGLSTATAHAYTYTGGAYSVSTSANDGDFYIIEEGFEPLAEPYADLGAGKTSVTDRATCQEHMARIVCETRSDINQIIFNRSSVRCRAHSADYTQVLMQLYDETPEMMRRSLCTLERIYLSDNIYSVAFASAITDRSGRYRGGFIGFRKQSFLEQPSAAELVSWKEQMIYGGSSRFLSNDLDLVQISYDAKMQKLPNDGLFYVLMHELAHLIDLQNRISESRQWMGLSWRSLTVPRSSRGFERQMEICFYNCARHINPRHMWNIYSSLQKSGFVSVYAGTRPLEDFAETWAWYLLRKYKSPDYRITVPGKGEIDMNAAFDNPFIAEKMGFIEALWNSPALKIEN